jgi:hypothetical protein
MLKGPRREKRVIGYRAEERSQKSGVRISTNIQDTATTKETQKLKDKN